MSKKKVNKKSKNFSEAIGLDKIANETTNFVLGLVVIAVAVLIIVSMLSYFRTGEID